MFDGNGCCARFCSSGQSSATESESDVWHNEARSGKDHKSCLRDEKQTSMTCSRMKNSLAGCLFRWLNPSCTWLQHPGLAPAAHLLAHLWSACDTSAFEDLCTETAGQGHGPWATGLWEGEAVAEVGFGPSWAQAHQHRSRAVCGDCYLLPVNDSWTPSWSSHALTHSVKLLCLH